MIRQATTALMLAAAAAVAPVAASASAVAGLPGFCPEANGVTVVVDFNELGGGTVVRCAPGAQANGLAALENAGFTVEGTQRWGKGFVCRISGKPGADTEACLNTPPASAYWSYWHAPDGGSWKYSNVGLLNRTPPPGSFEGWSFAKDKTSSSVPSPGVAPRRPQPPAPPPPPPVIQPPAGGKPPALPGQTDPAIPSTTATPPAPTEAPTSALASSSPSQELGTTIAEPPIRPASTPLGVIAAGVLLLGLATAALLIQRRRKTARDT